MDVLRALVIIRLTYHASELLVLAITIAFLILVSTVYAKPVTTQFKVNIVHRPSAPQIATANQGFAS